MAAAMVAPAFAAVEWMTDLEAAFAKAAAEQKAVLVDFTGSDWCGWCIKLKKEVLTNPELIPFLAENFVTVEIDVPQDASVVGGQEQLQKNEKLCARYGVEGYPTIMVMTAAGQIVGGFVGGADVKGAREALEVALANARTLQEAATMQGEAKAARLLEVYGALKQDFPAAALALGAEILAIQPDNEQLKAEAELAVIKAKFAAIPEDDYDAILALLDAEIKTAMPANQDLLKRSKAAILEMQIVNKLYEAQTVEEVETARNRLLQEVVPLVPQERQADMVAEIEKELGDSQAVLDALVAQREEEAASALSEADTRLLQDAMERVQAAGEDTEAALRIVDEAMQGASAAAQMHLKSLKATILLDKGQHLADTAESVEDIQQLRTIALQLIDLTITDDAERTDARHRIEQQFADPAAVLQELKKQR